jgi:type IV pilus assembly protein PilM
MASGATVIGLDVGTSAVRAVAVTSDDPPRLVLMGQVALPDGVVQEGEVVDPAAVADCLRTLWKEVGFKSRSVRLAFASARVIVRPVDMPAMSDTDTRAALRFQLADYIPLAPEETVFDFQPLHPGDDNDGRQVLLAAAPRDAVQPLIDAVKQAGLRVAHIDVAASALARVLTPSPSTEAIVSVGAGMIVVVVARHGEPVFARTLTNVSGRHVTDQIASDLSIPHAEAERLKQHLPDGTPADMAAGVLLATDPFVTEITEEIGDSLDYFAAQPGGSVVDAVTLTGGGALLTGVRERLGRRLGVPVGVTDPFAHLMLATSEQARPDASSLAPFMALAVGTALGAGRGRAKQINLVPASVRPHFNSRTPLLVGGLAAALLAGAVYIYAGQSSDISAAKAELARVEQAVSTARELAATRSTAGSQSTGAQVSATALLAFARRGDVDWTSVTGQLDAISETLGVSLTSMAGTTSAPSTESASVASPTTTTASATATTVLTASVASLGSLAVTGVAPDLNVVAAWIDAVTADERFDAAWVDTTTVAGDGTTLNFTATVALNSKDFVPRDQLQEASR